MPVSIAGYEIPKRFRGLAMRFGDPDRVLLDFIRWARATIEAPESSTASPDRAALRDACIELSDRLNNEALRERLISALAAVGVEAIRADGQEFDDREHRAIHSLSTGDPDQHNRVASTERLGFLDNGDLIRPAEVVVYRQDSASRGD